MSTVKSLILSLILFLALAAPGSVQAARALQTGPYPVTVTIAAISASPSYVGQPVTISVQVASVQPAEGTPSGTVHITSSQNIVCSIVLNGLGQGSCTLVFNTPAVVPLKAVYLGVDRFLPGTSSDAYHTVQARFPTSVQILEHNPSPSVRNQVVSVRASVQSGGPVPTGVLTIYRSETDCSLPPVASTVDRCDVTLAGGVGSCSRPLTGVGAVNLCAAYSGDFANLPSVGRAAHWISSSNTALGIQRVEPSPSLINQSAWVYFTVTSPLGTPPSSGLVTVTNGVERCSATLAEGRCAIVFRQPNVQTVVASYPGAVENQVVFEPSTSNPWQQRVNAPPVDILLNRGEVDAFLPINGNVGKFSASDPNTDETHTYQLVGGTGSGSNAYFSIQGSQLILARHLRNSGGDLLSIRVRSIDSAGLSLEKVFRIRVKSGELPATGFAPAQRTLLPAQPVEKAYRSLGELTLEIPALGISTAVVGVPWAADGWDSDWLGQNAGWLAGTAFPSWQGNTVLVGHNHLQDGSIGPFARLSSLKWGDKILVQAYGATSVYEVRSVEQILPQDGSALRHEENAWLTLITCQNYDEKLQAYQARVMVRAVLLEVRSLPEKNE